MKKLLQRMLGRSEGEDALNAFGQLSGSELNSVLLEIFARHTKHLEPPTVLATFDRNRFVGVSALDPIKHLEFELSVLRHAQLNNFRPFILSPVAPLGSCSALGTVSQNKILSSIRGTEVVADATNVLMLKLASDIKSGAQEDVLRYCTVHRHIRGQAFDNPAYTAHFAVYCQVSGGLDLGNNKFELSELRHHVTCLLRFLCTHVLSDRISAKIWFKSDDGRFEQQVRDVMTSLLDSDRVHFDHDHSNLYYQRLQFKIFVRHNDVDLDIADGGFVDWPQKLLGNRKQRGIVSGLGLELLQKLFL
jgi:hypothetical protein